MDRGGLRLGLPSRGLRSAPSSSLTLSDAGNPGPSLGVTPPASAFARLISITPSTASTACELSKETLQTAIVLKVRVRNSMGYLLFQLSVSVIWNLAFANLIDRPEEALTHSDSAARILEAWLGEHEG